MSKKQSHVEWSTKALRDIKNAQNELLTIGSDRACVIVGVALLEDKLRMLLGEYLPRKHDNSSLFESYGVLGTFKAKIELSYRIGLISEHEYKLLNRVRNIRNSFAHDTGISSFEKAQSIQDITDQLKIEDKLWFSLKLENLNIDNQLNTLDSNPRRKEYVKCVLWLQWAMSSRIIHAKHTVPEPVLPFIDALDMQEFLCDSVKSWINRCNIKMQDLREMRNFVLENNGNQETVSDIETNISLCEKQIKKSKEFLAVRQKFKKLTHEKMIEEGLLDNKQ